MKVQYHMVRFFWGSSAVSTNDCLRYTKRLVIKALLVMADFSKNILYHQ